MSTAQIVILIYFSISLLMFWAEWHATTFDWGATPLERVRRLGIACLLWPIFTCIILYLLFTGAFRY